MNSTTSNMEEHTRSDSDEEDDPMRQSAVLRPAHKRIRFGELEILPTTSSSSSQLPSSSPSLRTSAEITTTPQNETTTTTTTTTAAAAAVAAAEQGVVEADMMELAEDTKAALDRRDRLLRQVEAKHRSRTLAVPTDDVEVREKLREINEPITLFGERAAERRDRLKEILARKSLVEGVQIADGNRILPTTAGQFPSTVPEHQKTEEEDITNQLFFTEGSEELRQARLWVARFSLPRASARVLVQKIRYQHECDGNHDWTRENDTQHQVLVQSLQQFSNSGSQIGDDRAVNCIALSPNPLTFAKPPLTTTATTTDDHNQSDVEMMEHNESRLQCVLTASWSGTCKLWSLPEGQLHHVYRGHTERVTGVAFNPDMTATGVTFASASADSTAKLWHFEKETPLHTFAGHSDRLAKLAFHPSGKFLATCSFDCTWRLWDLTTHQCLLEQEGHSRAVYAIAFQIDGSLVATSDLGGIVRVWDLRTGRTVMPLEGHIKQTLTVDWSPNGFQLASGSDDHTIRIWDLRKKKSIYTIPAHNKLISQVRFEPMEGRFLISSSFDNTCKIWDAKNFQHIKTLAGHELRVLACDVSRGGDLIVSAGFDRTWKWYTRTAEPAN